MWGRYNLWLYDIIVVCFWKNILSEQDTEPMTPKAECLNKTWVLCFCRKNVIREKLVWCVIPISPVVVVSAYLYAACHVFFSSLRKQRQKEHDSNIFNPQKLYICSSCGCRLQHVKHSTMFARRFKETFLEWLSDLLRGFYVTSN